MIMNRLPFKIRLNVWRKIWPIRNSTHTHCSYPHKQQRTKENFGNKLIQTEIHGKPNLVTFRNKAREVLCDLYSQNDFDPEKDKLRIFETAAKFTKDDSKATKTSHWNYPHIYRQTSVQIVHQLLTYIFESTA